MELQWVFVEKWVVMWVCDSVELDFRSTAMLVTLKAMPMGSRKTLWKVFLSQNESKEVLMRSQLAGMESCWRMMMEAWRASLMKESPWKSTTEL